LVRRRAEGTPVAYLVGHREFYSLDFLVTPDVLIPRPETELIVVALLDHVKARPTSGEAIRVADVGAGSGILAVCGAKFVPKATVTAIDVSAAALAVARRNAERHGVADRIRFVESDLFANIAADERFDYIISNPPYVSTSEMTELGTDVREHEPHVALHAGAHGTDVIERLIPQAAERLLPGGVLLMEISPMIAERVQQQVDAQSGLNWVKAIRDHAGHARVAEAVRESS
jgi:release factor glutamine methyltransferase